MRSPIVSVTHVLHLAERCGENPVSGAEKQIFGLLETISKSGTDTELLAVVWSERSFPVLETHFARLRDCGVRVTICRCSLHRWRCRWLSIITEFMRLSRPLRDRRHRIIHMHLDMRFTMAVAWLSGCKMTILTVHNDEKFFMNFFWRLWLHVCRLFVWRFIGITDHVTDYFKHAARLPAEKVSTITYGISPCESKMADCDTLRISTGRFTLGFVGRLTKQKNLGELARAAAELPDVDFILVGEGSERAALEKLVQHYKLNNFYLKGAVINAGLYMRSFDLLILPSIWEGLGLVLLEAMSQGVPVAGSNRGSIPRVLDYGRCGMIFEPCATEIVSTVKRAINSPEEIARMAVAAKEFVASRFSFASAGGQTVELYQMCFEAFSKSTTTTSV